MNVAEVASPAVELATTSTAVPASEARPGAWPEAETSVDSKSKSLRERIFAGEGWSKPAARNRPHRGARLKNGFDAATIKLKLDTEVVADDNIFYSTAGEEVSDVIFRIQPGVQIGLGEEGADASTFAAWYYQPTASIFVDNDGENSFDHDLGLRFGVGGEKFQGTFDGGYQTLSEASVDVSERTDREVINAGAVMQYAIGGKTGVRAELGYDRADYEVLSGYEEWRADLYATYAIGGKTNVGLGYGYGQLSPEQQGDQNYQRALARADWQATAKLSVTAWGGADFRTGGGADDTTAVFGVELFGDVREGTRIRLGAGRDIVASALIDTETYTLTRVGAGIEQRLGDRFTGVLDVGFEDYDYSGGGELGPSRSDQGLFVRPSVRYRLREDLTAEVFYALRDSDSSINEFDFESNQFGASVQYEF